MREHLAKTLAQVCEIWDCLPKYLVGKRVSAIFSAVERGNVTVYWGFFTPAELEHIVTEQDAREVPLVLG